MTNYERQRRLTKSYYDYSDMAGGSCMGLENHCQYCEYQIGKIGSPTHNDQTDNCTKSQESDAFFNIACWCAKAYNKMTRANKKLKEIK